MKLKQYQIDAFADRLFSGNPAAVVPMDEWLPDTLLQAIAEENNLSETAFVVKRGQGYELRWFTPVAEVDLCGHATLAAAHALFCHEGRNDDVLSFHTRSGELIVKRNRDSLEMSFPTRRPVACATPEILVEAFGIEPIETLAADDYIAVYGSDAVIRSIAPNMDVLRRLDLRSIMITAPGNDVDFVSRFFAPKLGIPEDPVTGSAHCALTPYWSERLGRSRLQAFQCSKRGGHITCTLDGERVFLSGRAVTFMEGTISIV